MLFSSIVFLYYFLPITLILYFLCPIRHRNVILLLSSLFFYGWGEPVYLFLMLAMIFIAYLSSLLIEKFKDSPKRKFILIISIVCSFSILGYFKYANFCLTSFAAATGLSVQLLSVALPIGISFYTFQTVSYMIDVYRGQTHAQKNPLVVATYITMFPQLIAGPIVRYCDIENQLILQSGTSTASGHFTRNTNELRLQQIALGIRRFIIGLSKKIILANTLAEITAQFSASTDLSVLYGWIYVVSISLQIYFDFSGYSDMAIGLGKILGFEFPENFRYPFISTSVTEFWRRWHISLGSWFKDYLYIPLGGNRVSAFRHVCNILIVWAATGLWHGASWNFVIWGLYFAILLILEKYVLGKHLCKHPVIGHIYLLFFSGLSFVIFQGNSASEIIDQLCLLFRFGTVPIFSQEALFILSNYAVLLLISLLAATPAIANLLRRLETQIQFQKAFAILEPLLLLFLFFVCTTYLVSGSYNPFLYFRF